MMNLADVYSAFRYIGIRSTTMSRFFLKLTDGETFIDLGHKGKCSIFDDIVSWIVMS